MAQKLFSHAHLPFLNVFTIDDARDASKREETKYFRTADAQVRTTAGRPGQFWRDIIVAYVDYYNDANLLSLTVC